MKVRASVKKICVKCKVITRRGVVQGDLRERKAQAAPGLVRVWQNAETSTTVNSEQWIREQ